MFSTEFMRTISEERERQVNEHLRLQSLIRPHRVVEERCQPGQKAPAARRRR